MWAPFRQDAVLSHVLCNIWHRGAAITGSASTQQETLAFQAEIRSYLSIPPTWLRVSDNQPRRPVVAVGQ
jgi:hypothetical protein